MIKYVPKYTAITFGDYTYSFPVPIVVVADYYIIEQIETPDCAIYQYCGTLNSPNSELVAIFKIKCK